MKDAGSGTPFGVNSLSSKILCGRHNGAMSPLDTAVRLGLRVLVIRV